MKINKEFAMRDIMGEAVLLPMGDAALEFSGLITTNDVGSFLWQSLQQPTTREELLQKLLDEFEVDEPTAAADLDEYLDKLRQLKLLEE